ncbi:hypothetical protein QE361_003199 [Sphingomonas sp. SORGH_AS802]|jgi:hypothetical protein|uniref:phage tail length tape measure family protein n=1 Tax=unclassified Sphingomonas TaxID=196159 RepID=UPI00285F8F2A|nr:MULTISPECIES: phage tail length tape measure family protein [unclassified Sphingomonas]MDR6128787.1 hypothetical protein [Sphingomonas sp. SORGH_AS_0438]MDR6136198.1 hypothetical protein [Sphingomonas sp. SORGH_AS_0802]
MTIRSIGFNLRTDGKAQVKNDFAEIRKDGTDAMTGVAEAAERAAERSAEATDRFTQRQIESWNRQAAAAKLAAAAGAQRGAVDQAMATPGSQQFATVNLDRSSGAARDSAKVFQEMFEREEQAAAGAAKLRAALDPLYLARVRYDDQLRTANSLVSQGAITEAEHTAALKKAADAYREVADAAGVAAEKEQQRWREDAAAAKADIAAQAQQARFSAIGASHSGKSARDSGSVFEAELKAEEDRAAALAKIRAMIDPLSVAQARYDAELRVYNDLLQRGELSEKEHAQALAVSTDRLEEARQALDGNSQSAGLNRVQMMMLRSAGFNAYSSLAAGMPLFRVLMEQGIDVVQAMSMGDDSVAGSIRRVGDASQESAREVQGGSERTGAALDALKEKAKEAAGSLAEGEGGVGGALGKVRALLTPTRLAIGATAAVVAIATKSWWDYNEALDKLNTAGLYSGRSLGMTGQQIEAAAEAAASAGDITVSAAREIATAYVTSGNVTKGVLLGLTAMTKDFAAATGQDVPTATQALDAAMADPIDGAQQLAERYGWINQATIEYIGNLVEQNDKTGAQRVLMEALAEATDGAADKANALARGWEHVQNAASGAWSWLGKAIDRAAGGGVIAERIADIQAEKARGRSVWQMVTGTSQAEFQAGFDKQIADLQRQARKEDNQARAAATNRTQQAGASIVEQYTGDQRSDYQKTVGKLRAALATDLPADQRKATLEALDAYSHAIDTFIPRGEKMQRMAELDARIAAAKTPQAKAALATEKARLELSGQVITSAHAEAQAQARADRARASSGSGRDRHAEQLRREAESMEANARGALAVADAYLTSSAAGAEAEARRKALTDATRRGIDVDAQVRRQLALQVADAVAGGAKTVAGLRDETAARSAVIAQVRGGTLSVADMSRALSDEAAMRSLVKLRSIAQGDALVALNKVIDAYRQSLDEAHASEDRMGFARALEESKDRAKELKSVIADLSLAPLDQALNAASRAANREADKLHLPQESQDRKDLVRARTDEAQGAYEAEKARFTTGRLRDQADALEMSRREFELLGASDTVRAAELEKLRTAQEIRRRFPDLAREDAEAILAGVDAQAEMNTRLKIAAANLDEMRRFGSACIDTIFDEDTWSSWGNAGKTVLKMLRDEFMKLALLNPLKNLINGNSDLPTLAGALGKLGGLFGIGGSSVPIVAPSSLGPAPSAMGGSGIGRLASGTENWSGGLTWVGEHGPELADLPAGTRVRSAAASRAFAADSDGGPSIHMPITIDATGADAAGLARVEAKLDQLRQDLPGQIISVYQEARQRRVIR